MALEICQLPTSIEKLVSTVSWNREVYANLQELMTNARKLSGKYRLVMQNEGGQVLLKKTVIINETNPSYIKVEEFKFALRGLHNQFTFIRNDMFDLQAQIHHRIEDCRKLIIQHESTIWLKNKEVIRLMLQSNELEGKINQCEREASEQDSLAEEQDNEARRLSNKADNHKIAAVAGTGIMFGVGLLLAPFTGGVSAVLGSGAAITNLGGNIISAIDCENAAESHRRSARSKREDASNFRSQRYQLCQLLKNTETEIQNLERLKVKLAEEAETLRKLVPHLYPGIDFLNTKIEQIQDLVQTLTDAELEGDGFGIVQRAFFRNPIQYRGRAQIGLENLKEKWRCIESGLFLENRYMHSLQY